MDAKSGVVMGFKKELEIETLKVRLHKHKYVWATDWSEPLCDFGRKVFSRFMRCALLFYIPETFRVTSLEGEEKGWCIDTYVDL